MAQPIRTDIGRVPVMLDYLAANQLLAACEQRLAILEAHARRTGDPDHWIARAIVDTLAGEFAIRGTFGLLSEAAQDAAHEAIQAEMRELADAEQPESCADCDGDRTGTPHPDSPLAWAPGELTEAWGK